MGRAKGRGSGPFSWSASLGDVVLLSRGATLTFGIQCLHSVGLATGPESAGLPMLERALRRRCSPFALGRSAWRLHDRAHQP